MRVLLINSVCGIRSTGRICTDIADGLSAQGHEVKIAYGRETVPEKYQKYAVKIGSDFSVKIHGLQTRLVDNAGFGSQNATRKIVAWIKEYNPDVIHLHNLHGYYLNIEILFDYLKNSNKKIIWTLHDCWAFTGHCAYFDYVRCDRWKDGCHDCPQSREYPCSYTDFSKKNWLRKKEIFTDIPYLTIVTPSNWLANLAKQSYLKEYPVKVIHNGVDTNTFRYMQSDIKEKYGISDKKIILGVAAVWDRRKGLEYMVKLSEKLGNEYKVVIIGISEEQKKALSENVLGISRTNSTLELAKWYSAAECFVNPTLEDNYPTTNIEAIACQTPVMTFDTGGSAESAELYGMAVKKGDIERMYCSIIDGKFKRVGNALSISEMVDKYLELYEET